jgi:Protein of unknown function (DUF3379)
MMDCTDYRRSMLADPRDPQPRLREHRESCHVCNLYTERLLSFESRLDHALRLALPPQADAAAPRSAAFRKGWLAMAASVLLAFVVAGTLWIAAPGPSLAAAVVTHMAGEPDAWQRTEVPVPIGSLQEVLDESHLRLDPGAGVVSYASSCAFRGHHVPHLVIQTESGPATVMVLVRERVSKPVQFDEQGYHGVIVPVAGHGSLAVLTRGPSTDIRTVERIAARVLDSIVWAG